MLNPLNIAPASGQAAGQATSQTTGPKPDPQTSLNSEPHETPRGDETFESVLSAESDTADKAEDATFPDTQADIDPVPDPDEAGTVEAGTVEAGTDELAEFPILTDQATTPPDSDETFPLAGAKNDASQRIDNGGVIAETGRINPYELAGSGNKTGRESGHNPSPILSDRASGDRVIAALGNTRGNTRGNTGGNTGPLLTTAQSPQPIYDPAPKVTDQTILADDVRADTPRISTGPQAAVDDISPPKGGQPVHSLLGVALGQQASATKPGQTEALKNMPAGTRAIQLDPDQALPEKMVGDISQAVTRQPTATNQPGLGPIASAEAGKTYKNVDKLIERQKEGSRGVALNPADRSGQILPPPSGTISGMAIGPAPVTIAENQMDMSRVNWISETEILSDTGTIPRSAAPVTTSITQAFQHPDLPRHLAAQIASAAQRGGAEKPVEILLNPTELGRVKISMASIDGTMTVSVIADRPETLDLMRRHINVLAQEFLDIGYGQADFAFGQNDPQNGADSDQYTPGSPQMARQADEAMPDTPPQTNAIAATRIITDRVDIRL